ncbi:hypothetical protein BS50DRAFT_29305 [Corynespora cassiicola Philippines]|uniref:Uncharacterized protein n=1 Tax=Corynespora cassiicola Philippines TaxID=1448308 RepID=A0A2T2PBF2_CORCC|nr:hypothetical protein BS50DRAFT_29305 [Corynespora cassiicola Philippines]
MAPKKDPAADASDKAAAQLPGLDVKDTKLLAAAFVCSIGIDKYDYDTMATLTGFTAGTLKKFWPAAKKKAIDAHPSFGAFLKASGSAAGSAVGNGTPKPTPKARARKADKDVDGAAETEIPAKAASTKAGRKRKAPAVDKDLNEDDGGSKVNSATASADTKKAPVKKRARPAKQAKIIKKEVKETEQEDVETDAADVADGDVEEEDQEI